MMVLVAVVRRPRLSLDPWWVIATMKGVVVVEGGWGSGT